MSHGLSSGDLVDELRQLAQVPGLEDAVLARRIRLHDGVRRVPLPAGLRVEPVDLPSPLVDGSQGLEAGIPVVVAAVAGGDQRGVRITSACPYMCQNRRNAFPQSLCPSPQITLVPYSRLRGAS